EPAQRNHLKQPSYLLTRHNPQKDGTFDDLIDMYVRVNVKINMYIFACLSMYKINHFLC
ncbi:conjugal transfer protein TraG, partial [Bacillus wiedmannii]|nr:conjugal transfer protein TraG [Bacillus wiedmannii]